MENKIEKINNHEGLKIMSIVFGIIGISLLLVSIFTIPLIIIISIILLILGIIFSAIYKSKAGLIINIVGICLLPILIVGIILIKIMYFNLFSTNKKIEKPSESNYQNSQITNTKSNYENESSEIIKSFYTYFNSKAEKVIFFARSSCSYCELQAPIIENLAQTYNIDYLNIDTNELTQSEINEIVEALDIENATPTTVIVKNGKVLDVQAGYIEENEMTEFLKRNNIIKITKQTSTEDNLTHINYSEYKELIKKSNKSIIVLGQTGCSHCTSVKPKLSSLVKKYNIKINYLNITDMTQSERESLLNSLNEIGYDEEYFKETGSFGTPLTLIIENEKVISYVVGNQSEETFIEKFKNTKIITN